MNTPIRLLVVMDPIDHIKYQKDTTLALLLAAQAHGYQLHYAEMRDLRLRDGVAEARTRALEVRADRGPLAYAGRGNHQRHGRIST